LLLNVCVWRVPSIHDAVKATQEMPSVRDVLQQSRVRWLLVSVFFHVLAHMGIYVFYSLYLDALGYSKTMIGVLWAISVVAEIIWFMFHTRWLHWLSLPAWLVLCGLVMVARMVITSVWADVLWLLVVAQLTHAMTFAMHHSACVSLLSSYFPARLRARGQALYSSLGYGLPGVLGAVAGGHMSEAWGLQSVFEVSVIFAALGALCAWRLLRHQADAAAV
jgi:PPP family 3-phenylpropionic acid transporter